MMVSDFISKFSEALDIEALTINESTEFRNLDEWDSLAYLSIIAMLDEEYGIQIENVEFKKLRTISDIIAYIEANK